MPLSSGIRLEVRSAEMIDDEEMLGNRAAASMGGPQTQPLRARWPEAYYDRDCVKQVPLGETP